MSTGNKAAFRPAFEACEGRTLATGGLTAAWAHGQAWVEVANRSGHNVAYQISFNEGRNYSTFTIPKGGTAFPHVNRAEPVALIRLKGESPTVLATGPSKQAAAHFTIPGPGLGGASVPPGHGPGGGIGVGGGGGVDVGGGVNTVVTGRADTLPQAYVVFLNQSGRDVTLSFTNNNGWNDLNLTIGRQYFSLFNPYIVSLDRTRAGIKIQDPNGPGLQPLASSPTLNSAPLYIINTDLTVFRS